MLLSMPLPSMGCAPHELQVAETERQVYILLHSIYLLINLNALEPVHGYICSSTSNQVHYIITIQ